MEEGHGGSSSSQILIHKKQLIAHLLDRSFLLYHTAGPSDLQQRPSEAPALLQQRVSLIIGSGFLGFRGNMLEVSSHFCGGRKNVEKDIYGRNVSCQAVKANRENRGVSPTNRRWQHQRRAIGNLDLLRCGFGGLPHPWNERSIYRHENHKNQPFIQVKIPTPMDDMGIFGTCFEPS